MSLVQVLGVVLLSVQLYVFIRWNFAEIVEVRYRSNITNN